jgi:hypothetical protein
MSLLNFPPSGTLMRIARSTIDQNSLPRFEAPQNIALLVAEQSVPTIPSFLPGFDFSLVNRRFIGLPPPSLIFASIQVNLLAKIFSRFKGSGPIGALSLLKMRRWDKMAEWPIYFSSVLISHTCLYCVRYRSHNTRIYTIQCGALPPIYAM